MKRTRAVVTWSGALLALPLLFIVASTRVAGARVESDAGYTRVQTYNAALRYLRVDLGYEVTEKDADAAYLLFKFLPPGQKQSQNGAIEIVEQSAGVRIAVHLPSLPRYQEQVLSDGLFRKLRSDYGEPPRREAPPPRDSHEKKEKAGEGPDGGS